MKITLCDKIVIGDIPTYHAETTLEADSLIAHWLENKNYKESVFVCFMSWRGLEMEELRNEQSTFLVSHDWDDLTDFYQTKIELVGLGILDPDFFYFAIFEFPDYQEAFQYCIDLKEGF